MRRNGGSPIKGIDTFYIRTFSLCLDRRNGGSPIKGIDTPLRFCLGPDILGVEMEEARLRALTPIHTGYGGAYVRIVEMEEARLRALTLAESVLLVAIKNSRNGGSPIKGIDTFLCQKCAC